MSNSMRNLMKCLLVGFFFLIVISGIGCHSGTSEKADSGTKMVKTEVVKSINPNVIEMDHPEQFPIVEAKNKEIAYELQANGLVTPDMSRSVSVLSLAGGRVSNIRVKLGDDVKKGQLLLQIHSPDLAAAFSDYQKAQADELLARKQWERCRELFSRGAIAEKDLEAAQNTEEKAQIDVKTSANRLRVLGGDPDLYSTILDLRAPIAGTIVEQNVSGGTGVRSLDATPNLFTIADLSRVWVLCDLYEDAISQVRLGDPAKIRPNAYPDRLFSGRVSNISRILDPGTRSAKVRIELDNPGLVLRSGMFVTAVLQSQKYINRLVVPTSAIIRLHDRDWVFLALGGHRFRKTEIQTGPSLKGNLQQIYSGLQIHDQVVANALQFANASEVR